MATYDRGDFELTYIETEEFTVNKPKWDLNENDLIVRVKPRVYADFGDQVVGMMPRLEIIGEDGTEIMALRLSCEFSIATHYWDEFLYGDELHLPADILTHMMVLTIGTARGILHVLKPNWLEYFVLSSIDLRDTFPPEGLTVGGVE